MRRFFVLSALALVAIVLPAGAASAASWSGTWSTSWGPLTLSESGGTLSGPFGYPDSRNEPLGHITNATVNGNTLSGTWAHDPPATFAPRDKGTFLVTMITEANGTVRFDGKATYAADGTTADFFGTCTGGSCRPTPTTTAPALRDRVAPTTVALPTNGRAGTPVALRYRASDNSGKTFEIVSVYRGSTVIWTKRTALHAVSPARVYSVTYRLPAGRQALRFSVEARDAAGNVGKKSFAAITSR